MKCYNQEGKPITGTVLLASRSYPNKAVFRDDKNTLYLVEIKSDRGRIISGPICRQKAFDVADNCVAGVSHQGSMNVAMNAMAVTMLAVICEYEQIIDGLEKQVSAKL